MAFKMKGNPMKRNFGIGGPAKQSLTDKLYKDKFGTDPHDMAATQEVTPEESAIPQDKFANLANIDLNPKTGMGGKQGTHTMEGLE